MKIQATHLYKFLFFAAFGLSLHLFLSQGVDSGIRFPHADKIGHFIAFGGLTMLFDLGFNTSTRRTLLLALVYGAAIELIQGSLPAREASVGDLIADMAGSLSYFLLVQACLRAQLSRFAWL